MKKESIDPDSIEHPDTIFGEGNIVIPWIRLTKQEKLLVLISLGLFRPKKNSKNVDGEKPGNRKNQRKKNRGGQRFY